MLSTTTRSFRSRFQALSPDVRRLALKNFRLWLHDPRHPSIQFKKVGAFWSARVGSDHRAVGIINHEGVEWFWIGPHDEYERIIKSR